jgi:hypothetical protein
MEAGMAKNEAMELVTNLENTDIILAFSFDIIARIIPGVGFLFVYFPPSTNDPSSTSVADGIRILIVAYLIGITVDIVINPVEMIFHLPPMGHIIDFIKRYPQPEQFRLTKLLAEAVLFRSCAILSLSLLIFKADLILRFTEKYSSTSDSLVIFKAPIILKFTERYSTSLSIFYYYACVIGLIAVFAVCHIDRRIQLHHEEGEAEKETQLDQSAEAAHKLVGIDTLFLPPR